MLSFTIPMLLSWRTVERMRLTSATEHGEQELMVYNTHQPSSDKRPLKQTSRIRFAKGVIQAAIRDMSASPSMVGFVCAGDANCSRAIWQSASKEVRT